MTHSYTRALGLALTLAGALLPAVSRAATVDVQAGWDLFTTVSARYNFGPGLGWQDFHDDPITSYDFGPRVAGDLPVGVRYLFNTDTIIHRADATFDTPAPIVLEALSLVSNNAIAGSLGGTPGDHVKTQVISTDPSSQITISRDPVPVPGRSGTFYSILTLDFQLLDAEAVADVVLVPDIHITFTTNGIWSIDPDAHLVIPLIDGVNLTPGVSGYDFFTVAVTHLESAGADGHGITQTPLPAALWLFGSAVAGLGIFGKRRSSQDPA